MFNDYLSSSWSKKLTSSQKNWTVKTWASFKVWNRCNIAHQQKITKYYYSKTINTWSPHRTDFPPFPYALINPERAFRLPLTPSENSLSSSSRSFDHLLLLNSFTSVGRLPSASHLFPSFEESKMWNCRKLKSNLHVYHLLKMKILMDLRKRWEKPPRKWVLKACPLSHKEIDFISW